MVNKVMLIGNIGRNPELRMTNSGRAVANVSLATNRRWRDAQGNKQEATEWHTVIFWGQSAELADRLLSSGRLVYVEGRLQTNSWHDAKTGDKRYKTEVVCESFQLLGAPPGAGGGRNGVDETARDDRELGPEPADDPFGPGPDDELPDFA